MHVSSRHPNVVVCFEGWDDINLVDDCIVPALRHGSTRTLRVVTDEALLNACHLNLNDPHCTIFHSWGYAITSLHVERSVTENLRIDTIGLFYALAAMPSLVELIIHLHYLEHLAPVTETANIPFRLGRLELEDPAVAGGFDPNLLELHPVFRGWPRLIAQSAGTLRELSLHGARATALESGTFLTADESQAYSASLRSVTRLRLLNCFDPAIVRACPTLRNLELNCVELQPHPGTDMHAILTCLDVAPPTLQSLVLGLHPSHAEFDPATVTVFDLLPVCLPAGAGLRSITMQPCLEWLPRFQDVLNAQERRVHDVLQNFCSEHRILLIIH